MKRVENQTAPVATKTEGFVHIPEKVTIEKNLFTGMNAYIYNKIL